MGGAIERKAPLKLRKEKQQQKQQRSMPARLRNEIVRLYEFTARKSHFLKWMEMRGNACATRRV
jgi:hypothetical protein